MEEVEKTIQRMIEIYRSFSPEKLSSIILDSFVSSFIGSSKRGKTILQEYALQSLHSIYESRKQQASTPLFSKDMFAIGYLKVRLGNYEDAKKEFQSIKPDRLVDYIHQYRYILFSNNSSSTSSSWYAYLEIIRDYVPWSVLQLVISLSDDTTVSKPASELENLDAISITFTGLSISKLIDKIIIDISDLKDQNTNMGLFLFIIYLEHEIGDSPNSSLELYSTLASLYFFNCFVSIASVITNEENKEENNILKKKWMVKHDSMFIKLRDPSNWIDSLVRGTQKYASSFYLKKIQGLLSFVTGIKDLTIKQKVANILLDFTKSLSSKNAKFQNDASSLIIQLLCLPIIGRY